MSLAIFDLDNTLIGGDSDHLWGEFLVEQNLVDAIYYKERNDFFFEQYQLGTLNIEEYLHFALQPLSRFSIAQLAQLHQEFMAIKIQPILLPKALQLIEFHRHQHHTLMIITATNRFVTEPIARHFGITHLLASEAEISNLRYTGAPTGTPCFQQGKVTRLQQWLAQNQASLTDSYFYSDSANDIPLLDLVDHPVAVDPDPRLAHYAKTQGFPIISLR